MHPLALESIELNFHVFVITLLMRTLQSTLHALGDSSIVTAICFKTLRARHFFTHAKLI